MGYIELEGINKSFSDKKVLNDVSLTINEGEFATLLGPSGCGKTTLLRCIVGFENIDDGSIFLDGENITKVTPNKRNMGMIFQQYGLFPTMNVYNNIAFGLKMRKCSKAEVRKRVDSSLDMVSLRGNEKKYPSQLSGGEQQRVALARCLVTNPKVLLFDEPFSAIDAKLRKELQISIKEIHKELGMTSIFVTHDQEEAMRMSDRIFLLNKGKIEQSGTPLELYSNPKTSFVTSFIGNYNTIGADNFKKITGGSYNKKYSVSIRPEVITLSEARFNSIEEEYYYFEGSIIDYTLQGNVIRYSVNVNNNIINVDLLFNKYYDFKLQQTVYLKVKEKYIIFLDKEC